MTLFTPSTLFFLHIASRSATFVPSPLLPISGRFLPLQLHFSLRGLTPTGVAQFLCFPCLHILQKATGADWSTCTGQTWLLCDWSKCLIKTQRGKRLMIRNSILLLLSILTRHHWSDFMLQLSCLTVWRRLRMLPGWKVWGVSGSVSLFCYFKRILCLQKAKKDRCPVIKTHFCQTTAFNLHNQNIAFPVIVYFTIKVDFRQSRALNVRLQQQNIFWGSDAITSCHAALLSINADWYNRKHIYIPLFIALVLPSR